MGVRHFAKVATHAPRSHLSRCDLSEDYLIKFDISLNMRTSEPSPRRDVIRKNSVPES